MKYRSFHLENNLSLCCQSRPFFKTPSSPSWIGFWKMKKRRLVVEWRRSLWNHANLVGKRIPVHLPFFRPVKSVFWGSTFWVTFNDWIVPPISLMVLFVFYCFFVVFVYLNGYDGIIFYHHIIRLNHNTLFFVTLVRGNRNQICRKMQKRPI